MHVIQQISSHLRVMNALVHLTIISMSWRSNGIAVVSCQQCRGAHFHLTSVSITFQNIRRRSYMNSNTIQIDLNVKKGNMTILSLFKTTYLPLYVRRYRMQHYCEVKVLFPSTMSPQEGAHGEAPFLRDVSHGGQAVLGEQSVELPLWHRLVVGLAESRVVQRHPEVVLVTAVLLSQAPVRLRQFPRHRLHTPTHLSPLLILLTSRSVKLSSSSP